MRQRAQIQKVLCDATLTVSVTRGLVSNSKSRAVGREIPAVDKLWIRGRIGEAFGRLALRGLCLTGAVEISSARFDIEAAGEFIR
jgi:hypothetical protein